MAVDEVFQDYRFAALYDEFNPWSASDDFYLDLARESGGPVLEIGCGTGAVTVRLVKRGARVTALDQNPEMLERARARLVSAPDGGVTWLGDRPATRSGCGSVLELPAC